MIFCGALLWLHCPISALYPLGSQYLPFCLVLLTFWVHILQWFLCNIMDPLIFFLAFAHIDLTWIHTLKSRLGIWEDTFAVSLSHPGLFTSYNCNYFPIHSFHWKFNFIFLWTKKIPLYAWASTLHWILLALFHFLLILKKSAIAGISLEDYWVLGIWSRVM